MKLLIVDDHALFREGIALVLERLEEGLSLLEAPTGVRALEISDEEGDLDLVLLDLTLPGDDGLEILREFGRRRPETPVVMLSSSEGPAEIARALELGARGYIPKTTSSDVMLQATRLVLAGGVYVPPQLLGVDSVPQDPSAPTPRQREVLEHLAEGRSNKEIGNALGIAENTVRVHVAALLRTLGASNRTEASAAARKRGWV